MKRPLIITALAILITAILILTNLSQNSSQAADQATTSQSPSSIEPKPISPSELKALEAQNSPFTLIDVRTAAEFAASHIEGATLLPHDQIETIAPSLLPDKSATIVVYCTSGVRSHQAATALTTLGYENVLDLGGLTDWPYETTSENSPPKGTTP